MIREGTKHWDGTQALDYLRDDGGRADAGFRGKAGDCVARSVAIASGLPYAYIYKAFADGTGSQRATKRGKRAASARSGINVRRKWFRDCMHKRGFEWVPTMRVGEGCKVHLLRGELPMGRLLVAVSKHYTAVIDGVIRDTHDPSERGATIYTIRAGEEPKPGWRFLQCQPNGQRQYAYKPERCVYGYWKFSL